MKKTILMMLLVVLTMFTTIPVYASTYGSAKDYLVANGLPTDVYSSDSNNFIYKDKQGNICYFVSSKEHKVFIESGTNKVSLFNPNGISGRYFHYTYADDVWRLDCDSVLSNDRIYNIPAYGVSEPLYSDSDIYKGWQCLEVFFCETPTAPTLQAVTEKVELTEVIKQIVGLIPLVIGLVVLAISLRKALATLQRVLHRA